MRVLWNFNEYDELEALIRASKKECEKRLANLESIRDVAIEEHKKLSWYKRWTTYCEAADSWGDIHFKISVRYLHIEDLETLLAKLRLAFRHSAASISLSDDEIAVIRKYQ